MKLGEAYHALCCAMAEYAPFPEDAVTFLMRRMKESGMVHYRGEWVSLTDFRAALTQSYKSVGDIRLTFFGGPPDRQRFYEGSLLEFVMDRLQTELLVNKDPHGRVYKFIRRRLMEKVERHELEYRI